MGTDRRNVVLVTVDSLRADHCGFIEESSTLTPTLDRLAESGDVFESAVAPGPRTPSSVPEFLTGEPMAQHESGSRGDQMARIRDHLDSHRTIAATLSDMGYTTAAFSANPWTAHQTGIADEFDQFHRVDQTTDGTVVHKPGVRLVSGTPVGSFLYYLESWWEKRGNFAQWPVFFEDIVDEVDDLEEPYFIWIFLMDTHNPYIVPPIDRTETTTWGMYYGMFRGNSKFRHVDRKSYLKSELPDSVERRVQAAYRDAVRSVDRFAGRLVDTLAADDPVFLYHADHGEAFGEHGGYGHQDVLYEENIHVPLLITRADEGDGKQTTDPISLRALPPLIEELATGAGPIDYSKWTDSYAAARTWSGDTVALRGRRWKYLFGDAGSELYDLKADPGETTDVASEEVAVVDDLSAAAEAFLDTIPEATPGRSDDVSLSTDVKQRLERLGYTE